MVTKRGGNGEKVRLRANFFPVTTNQDWALENYRVDFEPEEDRTFIKKQLVRAHREVLGAYIFDGSNLYTSTPLTANILEVNNLYVYMRFTLLLFLY